MKYKGCIIEESLKDNRIMNQFSVVGLHISSDENPTDRWHIYTIELTKKQMMNFAKNFNDGKWYAHFWDKNGNVVVIFSDSKIFEFNFNDRLTWKDYIAHGLKFGIIKEQLEGLTID